WRRRVLVVVRPTVDLLVLAVVDPAGPTHVRELPDHREAVRGDLLEVRRGALVPARQRRAVVLSGAGRGVPRPAVGLVPAVEVHADPTHHHRGAAREGAVLDPDHLREVLAAGGGVRGAVEL